VADPETFKCVRCKQQVALLSFGTAQRNHCSNCLWSRHLDNFPGDRKAECGSAMAPIAVFVGNGGEWMLIHRCQACNVLHENRIAGDDNLMVLMSLAARPLAQPPVPLDFLAS
jgi:ribosome biogenesis GTPase